MNTVVKNVDKLKDIVCKIKSYDVMVNKEELPLLFAELEKISRKEKSKFYLEYFTDVNFALKIISLARSFKFNEKEVTNIVSLLGNMVRRYGLPPLDEIFYFLFSLKDKKKVSYYVSLFITAFPQFHEHDDKWRYLTSMPKIAPKDKSERNFYFEVKKIISSEENIPSFYKDEIISKFEEYLDKAKNEIYKNEYKEIIKSLLLSS
ncbi:hypothetical protein ACILPN_06585 [Yersinia wautersii]|uniref:Uncharacterized protein n=2 Tax=Yersinia pseudotuberculosis TaxID=633 RepID=A0A380Q3J5_YERPU|nr:hypothetical protein [Yersinia pseudotuberculosis]SUP80363.1 Uncharacterised protein [Yersinia pseudotuberculosis]